MEMVRFTLFCRNRGSNLRMEFGADDKIGDVDTAVREALGFDGFILRNGYSLLSNDQRNRGPWADSRRGRTSS